MRRQQLILLSLLLFTSSLLGERPGDVVAIVDGTTSLTRQEIDAAVAQRLAKIAADEEQVRRDVLQQLINEKLLAAEAARRGVTVQALLAATPSKAALLAGLAEKAGVHVALQPARTKIATEGRPAVGPAKAPVTLVVFSDFQCPYCRGAADVVREVQRAEGDRVRLVYRHFPLPIHDRAERAAEAAECASLAGKFWPVHDALFASPEKLSDADLTAHAVAAGVDREAFTQCLASGVTRTAIEADRRAAIEAGVEGTPAIFVNGRRLTGPRTVDALRRLIAEEKGPGSKGATK